MKGQGGGKKRRGGRGRGGREKRKGRKGESEGE